jgi:hypothetical protein
MEDEGKIKRLAELVVQKHGRNTRAILRERIDGRLQVRDYHLVALWALVAEAAECILPHARRQHRIERRAREIIAADVATRESVRGNNNAAIGGGRV